ncbi:MAG TPA: crosslink repair DNA glycosylase YcaQ family protein [Candidatus Dormibacteraeota bacterium]|nr:crosslink repair DNA glycosylase YcaQ family protein [Candidatus Dormibacteraeota bacterium]
MAALTRSPSQPQLSLAEARQLAVWGQRLLTAPAPVDVASVTRLVEQIGYLQRDPVSIVAPSHLLVLWSRLGMFDQAVVGQALWHERSLFEYWAHGASIIPTGDLPAHRWTMRNHGRSDKISDQRLRTWMAANRPLRRQILSRLRERGPLPASAFDGEVRTKWQSSGWNQDGDVERMLTQLWRGGRIAVAGRDGRGRLWELTERWLDPAVTGRYRSGGPPTEQLAERSLRALGVGTELQIRYYMGAGRSGPLAGVLDRMVRRGTVFPVTIQAVAGPLPGKWFVHRDDLEAAAPRTFRQPWATTLLSPFDNLIITRDRTQQLFGFDFRMEIYVPAQLRRYGYYVLPILHQDRLIGRVDLRRDRARSRLVAVAVHGESGAPPSAQVGQSIRDALERLGKFVGAGEVEVGQLLSTPPGWARALRH